MKIQEAMNELLASADDTACGGEYELTVVSKAALEQLSNAVFAPPELPPRELATVLAGLRLWQSGMLDINGPVVIGPTDLLFEIADDGGDVEPLTSSEIDTLCERLNCSGTPGTPPRVIVCTEGGIVTSVMSAVPLNVSVCDFDPGDEEEEALAEALSAEAQTLAYSY